MVDPHRFTAKCATTNRPPRSVGPIVAFSAPTTEIPGHPCDAMPGATSSTTLKVYTMSIRLTEEDDGKRLIVQVSGKLVKADYEHFVPEFERLIRQHGALRLMFDMTDFHGWEASAMWEDAKLIRHFADIERLAMVGETRWQHGMAIFCKPFTKATVRYFDHTDLAQARAWLAEA